MYPLAFLILLSKTKNPKRTVLKLRCEHVKTTSSNGYILRGDERLYGLHNSRKPVTQFFSYRLRAVAGPAYKYLHDSPA